jgi:hypothetical protein
MFMSYDFAPVPEISYKLFYVTILLIQPFLIRKKVNSENCNKY